MNRYIKRTNALKFCAKSCIRRSTGNILTCLRGSLQQLEGIFNASDSHYAHPLGKRSYGMGYAGMQISSGKQEPMH